MVLLGIDAGGSKALFSICDEGGRVLGTVRRPGITPTLMNEAELRQALVRGVEQLMEGAGMPQGGPAYGLGAAVFGMPCYGESETGDEQARRVMDAVFAGIPHRVVNDSEVAWAGSLRMRPGINVVCGTGTIAFGVDTRGNASRCGGWSYHFSDEGSGYWLGKKLLELFCKQSDGRIPERGAVYELVRARFGIQNDFALNDIAEQEYIPHRDKVAALQRLLYDAACQGDQSAIDCYREAGREIALCVRGILTRLAFDGPVRVSYSGGIFNAGALVMDTFEAELASLNCALCAPVAKPYAGALMMAMRLAGTDTPEALDRLVRSDAENTGKEMRHAHVRDE